MSVNIVYINYFEEGKMVISRIERIMYLYISQL